MTEKPQTRILTTLSGETDGTDGHVLERPEALVVPVTDELTNKVKRAVNAMGPGGIAEAAIDIPLWAYGMDACEAIRAEGLDGAKVEGDPLDLDSEEQIALDLRRLNLNRTRGNAVFGVIEVTRQDGAFVAGPLNLTDLLGITPAFHTPGSVVATDGFEGIIREVQKTLREGPDESESPEFVAWSEDEANPTLIWDVEGEEDEFAERFVPNTDGLMALLMAEPAWMNVIEAEWEPYTDDEPPRNVTTMLHEVVRQAIVREIREERGS